MGFAMCRIGSHHLHGSLVSAAGDFYRAPYPKGSSRKYATAPRTHFQAAQRVLAASPSYETPPCVTILGVQFPHFHSLGSVRRLSSLWCQSLHQVKHEDVTEMLPSKRLTKITGLNTSKYLATGLVFYGI